MSESLASLWRMLDSFSGKGKRNMNYHIKCLTCGATWWSRGSYESDTNATILDESTLHEGECQCGDEVEIFDAEYIEEEP